jgi:TatD DNase family protein
MMRFYDAHNHLQDERLAPHLESILAETERAGVARMVVNGSCEQDWPQVAELARRHPGVLPSFGYHPWYVHERTPNWQSELSRHLDAVPSAVGEIGLDKWILEQPQISVAASRQSAAIGSDRSAALCRGAATPQTPASLPEQEEVFIWQLRLAAERNLPVSIHCLQAWGPLVEILRREPRPRCGFVLHSYGGSAELVAPLAKLGAYFSLPGYFAHERKHRQREAFLTVPPDRMLIETDAPDQLLPAARNRHPLADSSTGKELNHPANLVAVYEFAAELFGEPVEQLAARVEENFHRLFGLFA